MAVVNLNNELKELFIKEQEEIEKILAALSAEISATAVLKENDGRFFNFEVSASDAKGIIADRKSVV